MIYVVLNDERGTILNRCDAWSQDSDMEQWAEDNGYVILNTRITLMGDMIITVE